MPCESNVARVSSHIIAVLETERHALVLVWKTNGIKDKTLITTYLPRDALHTA